MPDISIPSGSSIFVIIASLMGRCIFASSLTSGNARWWSRAQRKWKRNWRAEMPKLREPECTSTPAVLWFLLPYGSNDFTKWFPVRFETQDGGLRWSFGTQFPEVVFSDRAPYVEVLLAGALRCVWGPFTPRGGVAAAGNSVLLRNVGVVFFFFFFLKPSTFWISKTCFHGNMEVFKKQLAHFWLSMRAAQCLPCHKGPAGLAPCSTVTPVAGACVISTRGSQSFQRAYCWLLML